MNATIEDPCWTALALGELEGPEKAEAEKLLATHPELAEAYAELARTVSLLQEEIAEDPVPEFEADRRKRVLHEKEPRRPLRLWVPTAVAAALAVGFGLFQFLPQFDEPTLPSEESTGVEPAEESAEVWEDTDSLDILSETPPPAPSAEMALGRDGREESRQRVGNVPKMPKKDLEKNQPGASSMPRQQARMILSDEMMEAEEKAKSAETLHSDSFTELIPTPTPTPTPTPVPADQNPPASTFPEP